MRSVLFAARSAVALHRLLDVLPVFAGDDRIARRFTLVPGSDFGVDALAAIEHVGARTLPWDRACAGPHDLILASSPKGELRRLRGTRVLLPHGAGFSKTVREEGSADSASGLDPAYLVPDGRALAELHALAHPSQVTRLASHSPRAAARAKVVGDPTLERILASCSHRDRYRAALGTGGRKLIAVTSTWGEESLLRRRPDLPIRLALRLPHDGYQTALIVHPNERSRIGALDLTEHLAPALDAGLLLAAPYEEWAAVLVAADAVVTDHGSTALYAAALDRPLIAACDGGRELIPGSPMAEALARSPRLDGPADLEPALRAHRPGAMRDLARSAFAEQGQALHRLREELYALLGLDPPPTPAEARVLPPPAPPPHRPTAFAVLTRVADGRVHVERLPASTDVPAHHLAAEHGAAGERHAQSAALLYRRPAPAPAARHSASWTADGWITRALQDHAGCRTAAVVLSASCCVLRFRQGPLLALEVAPYAQTGTAVHPDPAAALSAVHAWHAEHPKPPAALTCVIGGRPFAVSLRPATTDEARREV